MTGTAATATTQRMPRIDSLTGLRWWAAFGVFGFHMVAFAPTPLNAVFRFGSLGVTFFFVLSGFVLTWSWSPRVGARTFYWRRFARIYPSHLVALILAIPVFYAVSPDPAQWWVKPFGPVLILSVFLLQGWSRADAVLFSGNPAAWTLTCEGFFYALHPLAQAGLRRLGRRGALIAAAGVVAVVFAYRAAAMARPAAWFAAGLPWPVIRCTEFALGMTLAWAMRSGWRPRLPVAVGYLLMAAVLGFAAWGVLQATPAAPVRWGLAAMNELTIVACAATIVLVAARDLRGGRSWLRSRVLVKLGEWSYAFYLVHATVMYVLLDVFGAHAESWRNLTWTALAFALALAAAWALHRLVERPLERRMRRWWDARLAGTPTSTPTSTPAVTTPARAAAACPAPPPDAPAPQPPPQTPPPCPHPESR